MMAPLCMRVVVLLLLASTCTSQHHATNSSNVRGRHLKSDREWTAETGMVFKEGPFIVNGDAANTAQTPWFVHFGNGVCGASLISANRVLTAAHCIRNGNVPSTVRVGATTQSDGVEMRVRCATTHPNYDNFVTNDVAILKLVDFVPNYENVIAINTDAANPAAGQSLTAIGLGRTSTGGSVSNTLLSVTQTYVDPSTCNSAYGGGIDSNFHLCAVVANKGVCNGDSGGPLYDASFTQVGIVSFGSSSGCASGVPDGYTRVSYYSQWITEQLTDDSCDGCSLWALFCINCAKVRDMVVNAAASMFRGEVE